MNWLDFYPENYAVARERFRSLVQQYHGHWQAYAIRDEQFTIDIGRFGSTNADTLLILSSGLHGVEGSFGSAVQFAWMEHLHDLPANVAVLLIHALNPIGYANRRRFNEENIDLNRNFLAAENFPPLREKTLQSLYPRLDPFLNPSRFWPRFDGFLPWSVWYLARYGNQRLRETIPIGQYAFPKGLFFGGERPSRTVEIIREQLSPWLGGASQILHLDFHTGLGKWGTYKLLSQLQRGDPRVEPLQRWFGDAIETRDGPTAYLAQGDFGEWMIRAAVDRTYHYLCAEFGTYSNLRVLQSLRRENWAEHFAPIDSPIWERTKRDLQEKFVPRSANWRNRVLQESVKLIHQWLNKCA